MIGRRRALVAAGLLAALLAGLLGAWFVSGWADVRSRQRAERDAPRLAADRRGTELAHELRIELAQVLAREADRPYFHYQNLFHDPRASGVGVAPSPLAQGPRDPLVLGHFQLDAAGQVTTPTINDELPELSDAAHLADNRRFRDEVARSLAAELAPHGTGPLVASLTPPPAQSPAAPRPAVPRSNPPPPRPDDTPAQAQQAGREDPQAIAPQAQVVTLDPSSYAQNNMSNSVYIEQRAPQQRGRQRPRHEASTPRASTSQPATPQGSTPQGSASQAATSQGSAPQGSAPQGSAPQGSAPQGSTSQSSTAPRSAPQGSAPQGSTPQGSTSQSSTAPRSAPQGSALQGSALQGSAPQGSAPQGSAPQGSTPQGSTSQSSTAPRSAPQGSAPQGSISQRSTAPGSTPQGSISQRSTPQGSAPQGSAPQGSAPQGSAPQGSTSQSSTAPRSAPQGSAPQGSISQRSTAPGSAPQGSAPQGSAPQGSAPQGSASQGSTSQSSTAPPSTTRPSTARPSTARPSTAQGATPSPSTRRPSTVQALTARASTLRPSPAESSVPGGTVAITVSPLEWRTLPFAGQPALVAVRQVDTPDGRLAQGIVIDRAALTGRLAGRAGDAVAELRPGDGGAEIAAGWYLDVAPNPRAVAAAALAASSVARHFVIRFITVGVFAALAAFLVVMLVARAERLARERSQFAAAAAHELRTPLAGLQLYGDMLADGLGDPGKLRDYARRMSEEASRLGRVVSNVLGFSQLERGNLSVDPRVGELDEALRELADRAEPALDRAGATLALDVAAGLTARFDRDALARIVGNLLDNAEKYSRGAGDRTIRLAARATGTTVEIVVSDHGPGVATRARPRLFQPFARGVSGDGPAGLGLGLALSRSLARAMGGDLVYRPTADGGASFALTLPPASSSGPAG